MNAAHLDHDTLADLAEGLLDAEQAASADAHLEGCAECQERATELAEVSRILSDTPTPPMPAEFIERLNSAIAAEAMSAPMRRRHRRFQLIAAAAAAVFMVGGGLAIARSVGLPDHSNSTTAASKPVEERTRRAESPSGNSSHLQAPGAVPSPAPFAGFPIMASGTDYTAADLPEQVAKNIKAGTETRAENGESPAISGTVAGIGECVATVGRGKTPLLVDRATYQSRSATIIVLPGANSDIHDIWVVGPRCSAATPDVIKHSRRPG